MPTCSPVIMGSASDRWRSRTSPTAASAPWFPPGQQQSAPTAEDPGADHQFEPGAGHEDARQHHQVDHAGPSSGGPTTRSGPRTGSAPPVWGAVAIGGFQRRDVLGSTPSYLTIRRAATQQIRSTSSTTCTSPVICTPRSSRYRSPVSMSAQQRGSRRALTTFWLCRRSASTACRRR